MKINGLEVVHIYDYPKTLVYMMEDGSVMYGPKEPPMPSRPNFEVKLGTLKNPNRAGRRAQKRAGK